MQNTYVKRLKTATRDGAAWFKKRLVFKLLAVLFFVGFAPFLFIVIYSEAFSEQKMHESALQNRLERIAHLRSSIETHMEQLKRQLKFLSAIDTAKKMQDGDPDQTITRLLTQYQKASGMKIALSVVDLDGSVVAATSGEMVGMRYRHYEAFLDSIRSALRTATVNGSLLLQEPIYAGETSERVVGFIVMEYALANLDRFNLRSKTVRTAIIEKASGRTIGTGMEGLRWPEGNAGYYEQDAEIIHIEELGFVLPGWYLAYRTDRSHALSFMNEFNQYLGGMLLLGVIVIALLTYWLSNRIIKPITELADASEALVTTQQYYMDVPVRSVDEIGRLAASYNALVQDIRLAFDHLQMENRYRLERLTQLAGLFNKLLQTGSESECLRTAIAELKILMPERLMRFTRYRLNYDAPTLQVYDFRTQTTKYYGAFTIPLANMNSAELAFFRAIAAMISSRIDQIRLMERLKKSSQAKSAFISHISHELRTPLHAIMGQTQQLIGYEKLSEVQQRKVGQIESSASHLLHVINDILDLAKLDAGKYEATLETVETGDIILMLKSTLQMLEPLAQQKGIALVARLPYVEAQVVADRRLLQQIIINLLSNAVKFTDSGSVTCRLKKEGAFIVIEVEDTGRGIDPDILESLFDDFTQSETANERFEKGTGLGLSLSRKFAELFGANVTLRSEGKGKGAVAQIVFNPIAHRS